jgi:seryl-tRNA(sec) selenium transferase
MDLSSGKRGERTQLIKRLLKVLTGCESAIVVNNNASAVMLAVSALARGKEVIVSRGELIEIGGSFRLPDVVTSAGGILKEVGTTNRTRAADYKNAISPNTGLILQCHRSNFEVTGFTEEASLTELVEIGRASGVPVGLDLGSGALIDIAQFGLRHEPTVDEVIGAGVSLVMFSGDKLLGGPQAGIIAGNSELVGKLRKDPMYRALRVDKLIITLLESVLGEYLKVRPEGHVPVYSLAAVPAPHIKERVEKFANRITAQLNLAADELKVVETVSTLGGGSLPGQSLPSFGLQLTTGKFKSAGKLSAALREAEPPVISIIQDDKVIVDFRAVLPTDEKDLERVVVELFKRI